MPKIYQSLKQEIIPDPCAIWSLSQNQQLLSIVSPMNWYYLLCTNQTKSPLVDNVAMHSSRILDQYQISVSASPNVLTLLLFCHDSILRASVTKPIMSVLRLHGNTSSERKICFLKSKASNSYFSNFVKYSSSYSRKKYASIVSYDSNVPML